MNRPWRARTTATTASAFGNYTVRRTEIRAARTRPTSASDNVVFADNYVHDLDTMGRAMCGATVRTPTASSVARCGNIVVRHNSIDPSPGGGVTAAIIMG